MTTAQIKTPRGTLSVRWNKWDNARGYFRGKPVRFFYNTVSSPEPMDWLLNAARRLNGEGK